MAAVMDVELCEGCEQPLTMVDRMGGWRVCLFCTHARQRAVVERRCVCGPRKRRESEVHETHPGRDFGRKWIDCLRCLGQIRTVR